MSGRQSGYIKNNKYFKYGKSVVSETTSIISQTMNERDKLRIFGKALPPVVKPVVKPVTDKTIKINQNFSLSRTIPKRIFFYWGGSDMSWMRYMTLCSFRKMNPDWEVVLYVSDNNQKEKGWKSKENQDYYQYKGDNYFNKLKDLNIKIEKAEFPKEIQEKLKNISPIHESDLFRYYQLYLNGGFYCDMDVLFFKPIDNFYNTIIKGGYDTIIHENKSLFGYSLTVGFLGASVNNEYYKNLFEFGINKKDCDDDYQSMGVKLIYNMFIGAKNPCMIYDTIISKYPNLTFYNLPTTLIYNFDWTQIKYCFTNSLRINDFDYDSIGYHWYGGGSESQKYNNILTEKNYKEYKTTFSTIADEVINMKVDNTGHVIFKNSECPKVSIVMTSFNRPKLLKLGLSSIAKQKIDYPFEIVVVNDGMDDDTKNVCDSYKNKLNIKYIFSGHRNVKNIISRSSPIPINIGIKESEGDIIILSCAEIFHLNNSINKIIKPLFENHNYLTIPESMYFDNSNQYTDDLIKNNTSIKLNTCELRTDHVQMPFLMGIWKQNIIDIGGYDEDLIGYASEDNDFVDRLKLKGCEHYKVDAKIVHLYHGERCSGNLMWNNPDWVYNRKIYDERKNIIVRNKDKEWGKLYTRDIPKILHLYWDKSSMSKLQTFTIDTFHELNPDWEINVYVPLQEYTGKDKYIPNYDGKNYFHLIENLKYVNIKFIDLDDYKINPNLHNILRSDIFRYYILYEMGGVWSDFDVIWLKPMSYLSKFINGDFSVIICYYDDKKIKFHNISILITVPYHQFYKDLIEKCQLKENDLNNLEHQTFGTSMWNEMFPNIDKLLTKYDGMVNVDYSTFFPYSIYNLESLYNKDDMSFINDNVMCVHWFNGHELSKEYVNNDGFKSNCSMTTILKNKKLI